MSFVSFLFFPIKGISLGAKPQAKEDISSFKNYEFSFFGFFVVYFIFFFGDN